MVTSVGKQKCSEKEYLLKIAQQLKAALKMPKTEL